MTTEHLGSHIANGAKWLGWIFLAVMLLDKATTSATGYQKMQDQVSSNTAQIAMLSTSIQQFNDMEIQIKLIQQRQADQTTQLDKISNQLGVK